jgi:predicted Fe-Mo cluster-binding NifX family protein
MRIAITTDQDFVSSCFGCTPSCTVMDLEAGRIGRTFVVPNPGWSHREWADFLERNAVAYLIVGNMGDNARAVLLWRGVRILSGVQGSLDEVVERFLDGRLAAAEGTGEIGCGSAPAECRGLKTT